MCTVTHLGIGISARAAAALLNVEGTTTASSADGVRLCMSLTERRSTLSLQTRYSPHSLKRQKTRSQIISQYGDPFQLCLLTYHDLIGKTAIL